MKDKATIESLERFRSSVASMNDLKLQIEAHARLNQIEDLDRQSRLNKEYGKNNSTVEKEKETALDQLKIITGELRRRLSNRSFIDRIQKRGVQL